MIRAVLGGSFDPPHDGHVAMARRVLEDGLADVVHVIPAAVSPFKDRPAAPAEDRLAMVELAFADVPGTVVDPREMARPAPSWTVDTLDELVTAYPDDHWRLVVGADQLDGFGDWREPARLLTLAVLIVLARQGAPARLPEGVSTDSALLLADFDEPVSSTDIRATLAAGRMPERGLAPAVAEHIRRRGLYGPA